MNSCKIPSFTDSKAGGSLQAALLYCQRVRTKILLKKAIKHRENTKDAYCKPGKILTCKDNTQLDPLAPVKKCYQ